MIADEALHRHAAENLANADALLFGRVTYEMMEAGWRPMAQTGVRPEWMPEWMEPFARTIDATKKYVVSSTLNRVDWNAELLRGGTAVCADSQPTTMDGSPMTEHRIFTMKFSSVYPAYVNKATRKQRTQQEVDQIICWLTGYTAAGLQRQLTREADIRTFFAEAPAIHPNTALITGVVCGVRVENVEDPLMRKIRYLDKLIDELARGKAMERILRQ
jgi:hypothetical protein